MEMSSDEEKLMAVLLVSAVLVDRDDVLENLRNFLTPNLALRGVTIPLAPSSFRQPDY